MEGIWNAVTTTLAVVEADIARSLAPAATGTSAAPLALDDARGDGGSNEPRDVAGRRGVEEIAQGTVRSSGASAVASAAAGAGGSSSSSARGGATAAAGAAAADPLQLLEEPVASRAPLSPARTATPSASTAELEATRQQYATFKKETAKRIAEVSTHEYIRTKGQARAGKGEDRRENREWPQQAKGRVKGMRAPG